METATSGHFLDILCIRMFQHIPAARMMMMNGIYGSGEYAFAFKSQKKIVIICLEYSVSMPPSHHLRDLHESNRLLLGAEVWAVGLPGL
jgi:hypothetical protein